MKKQEIKDGLVKIFAVLCIFSSAYLATLAIEKHIENVKNYKSIEVLENQLEFVEKEELKNKPVDVVNNKNEEEKWTQTYDTYKVSAYCHCKLCCQEFSDGKTATGRDASLKGAAVDKSVIPLGSRLDIPDYGNWILADDVGGAIKGKHIDIRFKTHEEAIQWGVKELKIRIWKRK